MITDHPGDALLDRSGAILTTVPCDGTIGAGLSLRIRHHYPKVFEQFRAACRQGTFRPGSILAVRADPHRWVMHMGIKDHLQDKAHRSDWQSGLRKLDEVMRAFNVHSIAVVKDGLGLRDINWSEALEALRRFELGGVGREVRLYRDANLGRPTPHVINARVGESLIG